MNSDTDKTFTREQLEEVLDERVRPVLKADGGDLVVERIHDDGTIVISFLGHCSGCPGVEYTLSEVIEPCLKAHLDGVRRVTVVPWHLRGDELG